MLFISRCFVKAVQDDISAKTHCITVYFSKYTSSRVTLFYILLILCDFLYLGFCYFLAFFVGTGCPVKHGHVFLVPC